MSGKAKAAATGAKKAPAKKGAAKGVKKAVAENPLRPSAPKNFRVGGAVRSLKRDVTRFVKWPRNVRLQRQKRVLYQRLKVPPAINVVRLPLGSGAAAARRVLGPPAAASALPCPSAARAAWLAARGARVPS